MEVNETHNKIIKLLEDRGPSLPVQIARELEMNSLFISAFLSELVNSKKVKVSSLKVGGSPLYFTEGQEEKLENFYNYLHPREAEAFLLIKENKVLKDDSQEPAIRVALRAIKDFAVPFEKQGDLFWKYLFIQESELSNILNPKPKKIEKPKKQTKTITKPIQKPTIQPKKPTEPPNQNGFNNPLIISEKPKKQKPKSEFVQKVINFINSNQWKIIKEQEYKAKEYNCVLQIQSQLGPINFLTQAKDKKNVSETDVKKLLSDAQKIPFPAFLLFSNDISKKALAFQEEYNSVLKVKRID